MSHRATALSIVAFCLANALASIVAAILFSTYYIDFLAPIVLVVALRVASGNALAIKWSMFFMALYVLVAISLIAVALLNPTSLYVFGRPAVPSRVPLVIVSSVVAGAWPALNLVALSRFLRNASLAA